MEKQTSILKEIDELITAGKLHEAKAKLLALKNSRLSRELKYSLAVLAGRLHLPQLSLIFLKAAVNPSARTLVEATPLEKIEYAFALSELGVSKEALKTLEGISGKEFPQALLYRCFSYIQTWDYQAAIPVLREYVESEKISDYQKIVGMTNLVSALVFEETEDSTKSVLELIELSKIKKFQRIHAYCLQLLAQDAINKKNWQMADKALQEAMAFVKRYGAA